MSDYKYPLDVINLSVTGWISGFLDWNTSGNLYKVSCLLKCFRLLYIATIHQIIDKIRVIDQTGIFEIEVSAEQKWAFLICGCF